MCLLARMNEVVIESPTLARNMEFDNSNDQAPSTFVIATTEIREASLHVLSTTCYRVIHYYK